jgi:hypothetical protein
MPVHEIRYRPHEGPLRSPLLRLCAIPKFSLKAVADRKFMTTLFGLGSLGLLVVVVYLYLFTNPAIVAMLGFLPGGGGATIPEFPFDRILRVFLQAQTFTALLVLLLAGPKSISPELQHQALPLLYSRPLTRAGYIAGKLAALALPLSYLFWIQALFIVLMMALLYGPQHQFHDDIAGRTIPAVVNAVLAGVVMTVVLSLVALGCSAATKNHMFAAGIFLALYFGSSVFSRIGGEILDMPHLHIGLFDTLRAAPAVFVDGSSPRGPVGVLLTLGGWSAVAILVMLARLRPVEVHNG